MIGISDDMIDIASFFLVLEKFSHQGTAPHRYRADKKVHTKQQTK